MEQRSEYSSIYPSHLYNLKDPLEPPFIDLFYKLREADILLTVDDYKLLIISTRSGFGLSSKQEFKALCSALWVKSLEEERVFDKIFSQYADQTWNNLSRQHLITQNRGDQALSSRLSIILKNKKNSLLAILLFFFVGISSTLLIEKSDFSRVAQKYFPLPTENRKEEDESLPSWIVLLSVALTAVPTLFMVHLIVEAVLSYDNDDSFENTDEKDLKASEQVKGESKVAIRQEETSSIDFGSSSSEESQNQISSLTLMKSLQRETLAVRNEQHHMLYARSFNERLNLQQMKHAWRYLWQPAKQGAGIKLDIEKTVDKIAQQGMFLSPVFEPNKVNKAEVVLMIDWGGSMLPFHNIADDLIKTALSSGRFNRLTVCYFKNFPKSEVFSDRYFIKCIPLTTYLKRLNYAQSSIIVVSDAGAARGSNNIQRYKGTEKFINTVQHKVKCMSWLNPMPRSRWLNTSAEKISMELVPMFEITYAGMRKVVRASKGESQYPRYSYSIKNKTQN